LGKTISALANFKEDPTVAVCTCKLVFLNEFGWDVCDFDADIFRIGHWGIKVEVLEVNGAEARTFVREHTVEEHLEEFEGCGVGAILESFQVFASKKFAIIAHKFSYDLCKQSSHLPLSSKYHVSQ